MRRMTAGRVLLAVLSAATLYVGLFGPGGRRDRSGAIVGALVVVALLWVVGYTIERVVAKLAPNAAANEGLTLSQMRGRERFALWVIGAALLVTLARWAVFR